jgi:hypothetical protein
MNIIGGGAASSIFGSFFFTRVVVTFIPAI